MNTIHLMGRLTRDPSIHQGQKTKLANYSIAVNRRYKREGQPEADFFNIVSFGKAADFVEKYLKKGTKVVISGEMQNDNYTDRHGNMVYSYQVITNSIEFAESKKASQANTAATSTSGQAAKPSAAQQTSVQNNSDKDTIPFDTDDDFMNIPEEPADTKASAAGPVNDGFVPVESTDDLPFD